MNAPSRSSRRGSAMLESSLVLLVFLTLLIAAFDMGQFLFLHHALAERLRSSLRYAIVNDYDATAIQNMVLYGQTSAPPGATPYFNLTAAMVSVSRQDPDTNEDRIVITISNYPFKFLTPGITAGVTGRSISASLSYENQ